MNIEEAKAWAVKELEYLDRRIVARTGTVTNPHVLLGLIESRAAIELLLDIAALHTEGVAGLADLQKSKGAKQ